MAGLKVVVFLIGLTGAFAQVFQPYLQQCQNNNGGQQAATTINPVFSLPFTSTYTCGAGQVIHIEDARWVSNQCNTEVTAIYRHACEGRTSCDLSLAPKPEDVGCHYDGSPFVQYTATCVTDWTNPTVVSTVQNVNKTISCPAGQQIYVLDALYASGPVYANNPCNYSVHAAVSGICDYKNTCDLNPASYRPTTPTTNGWFTYDQYYGTDCPGGSDRILTVSYVCSNPPANQIYSNMVSQGTTGLNSTLSCPLGTQINVRRGSHGYGKFMDDSTITWRGICSLQQPNFCTYNPWTTDFGDYDGHWDFDIVYWSCDAYTANITTDVMKYIYVYEGYTASISCPNGTIIDIDNAWFGAGGWQGDVTVSTKTQCQTKQSCSFTANTALFGTPYGGVKHLTVGYVCRAPRYNDLTYVVAANNYLLTIDCKGRRIVIGEAFYGYGYIQQDVSSNRVFDRCETPWYDTEAFRNNVCLLSARDVYFGTVSYGYLTVGYYCQAGFNANQDRRIRQNLFDTGVQRGASYPDRIGTFSDHDLNEYFKRSYDKY